MGICCLIVTFLVHFFVFRTYKLKLYSISIVFIILLFINYFYSDLFSFVTHIDFRSIVKAEARFERLLRNPGEEDRIIRWTYYLSKLSDHPFSLLFGLGLRNVLNVGPPHNTIILISSDFGLLALLSFMSFIVMSGFLFLYKTAFYLKSGLFFWIANYLCLILITISNDAIESRTYWVMLFFALSSLLIRNENSIPNKLRSELSSVARLSKVLFFVGPIHGGHSP
jgi:hypothetical protein